MSTTSIKVLHGALDETPLGDVVLRGVIDSSSLHLIQADSYQREILSDKKVEALMKALCQGQVPDIVLGMRGDDIFQREGNVFLQSPTYVIDGLQRTTAAMRLLSMSPQDIKERFKIEVPAGFKPHLGSTIHFDTCYEAELAMFQNLNLGQTQLSGNVTLRNLRTEIPAMQALHRLTEDRSFALCHAVSWSQHKRRTDLITAITFVKVVAMLHSNFGPGRSSSVNEVARGLQKIMDNIGKQTLVQNTRAYFEFIDKCWSFKSIVYRDGATFLKSNFLRTLAQVVSDHEDFWDGDKFTVSSDLARKIATFPLGDPHVKDLIGGSGSASHILYSMIVDHINAGKRTRRLRPRRPNGDKPMDLEYNEAAVA